MRIFIASLTLICGTGSLMFLHKPTQKINPNQKSDTAITKIFIAPERWYILNHAPKGIAALFNGKCEEAIQTGFSNIRETYECVYPLDEGESISISQIKMYDWAGDFSNAPAYLFAIKKDGSKCKLATFLGNKYNQWVGPYPERNISGAQKFTLDSMVTDIQYLVLTCTRNNLPTEIELYGNYTPPLPVNLSKPLTTGSFSNTLGMNAFEWDFVNPKINSRAIAENKYAAIKNFTGFRHYLDWRRMEDAEGKYSFSPCHYGGWDYDMIYERCKRDGIEVLACIKNIPTWMVKTYPEKQQAEDNLPSKFGLKRNDPASYIQKGKMAFQFAARYGRQKNLPLSLIKVDTKPRWKGDAVNAIKRGMDLVKYMECGNELDKWWKGSTGYMDCYEYAALLSAFYDGHKKQLGENVGVKNADSSMQVVIGGLAFPSITYLRGMIEWCRQNRGYKTDGSINLCWDVINYHHYANNAGLVPGEISTNGIAPELAKIDSVATSFINISARMAGGMPVWVTELGYDINPGSSQKAIPIGKKTAAQTQADWLLRSALIYLRAGIERTFFYELKDLKLSSPGKYASMGLTDSLYRRRLALDYLVQTKQLLGNFHFSRTISHNPEVDEYANSEEKIYAVWMPTQQGLSKNCTVSLENASRAVIYQPQSGASILKASLSNVEKGQITIIATETPVFIKAEK